VNRRKEILLQQHQAMLLLRLRKYSSYNRLRSSASPIVLSRHRPIWFSSIQIDAANLFDTRFRNAEEVQKWIDEWITSKDKSFYRRGIKLLPRDGKRLIAIANTFDYENIICHLIIINE